MKNLILFPVFLIFSFTAKGQDLQTIADSSLIVVDETLRIFDDRLESFIFFSENKGLTLQEKEQFFENRFRSLKYFNRISMFATQQQNKEAAAAKQLFINNLAQALNDPDSRDPRDLRLAKILVEHITIIYSHP